MTETAQTVVNDILEDLLVQASESRIEPADAQATIRAMNRYMARISSRGINLGYTKVSKLDDPITIPEGAIDGLIANVALRLWPKYRTGDPSGILVQNAIAGLEAMIEIAISIEPAVYPETLPKGSGNTGYSTVPAYAFYPGVEDEDILTEANGAVGLEEGT